MSDATHQASATRPRRPRRPQARIWTVLLGARRLDEERLERERARHHAWVRDLLAEISAPAGPYRSAG